MSERGYKAFEQDLTCRGFQYEVGKTYKIDGEIALCESGFHFCKKPTDCFQYYDRFSRLCEVEADGLIIHGNGKSACSMITIIREIGGAEKNRIVYGYGNGYGNGYGYGYGDGNGDGYGDGDGYGYGNGYGKNIQRIMSFKEEKR